MDEALVMSLSIGSIFGSVFWGLYFRSFHIFGEAS